MTNQNDRKSPPKAFTIDVENTGIHEMPSVTKLLNRKRLETSDTSTGIVKPSGDISLPLQRGGKVDPNGTGLKPYPLENATQQGTPAPMTNPTGITPVIGGRAAVISRIRPRGAASELGDWNLGTIKSGTDPLGKGASMIIEKAQAQGLFLAFAPPLEGKKIPTFKSLASICATPEQKALWKGIVWNPDITPELWNDFVKTGFLELIPTSKPGPANSHRLVARAAFGAEAQQWLLLVRCGPSNACRGVLAFVASQSMVSALSTALTLITAPVAKAAA